MRFQSVFPMLLEQPSHGVLFLFPYCVCRHERTEADSIFRKDLKVFSVSQNRIDCELAELLALKDLRHG